jgi:hypothetical protein
MPLAPCPTTCTCWHARHARGPGPDHAAGWPFTMFPPGTTPNTRAAACSRGASRLPWSRPDAISWRAAGISGINPVRSGLVDLLAYQWSKYPHHAGHRADQSSSRAVLGTLGNTPFQREAAYIELNRSFAWAGRDGHGGGRMLRAGRSAQTIQNRNTTPGEAPGAAGQLGGRSRSSAGVKRVTLDGCCLPRSLLPTSSLRWTCPHLISGDSHSINSTRPYLFLLTPLSALH